MLVLFCHPARHRSRVNAALANAVRDLPGVTFHDLYDAYPEFGIDVAYEQALLLSHEVIVWQHPIYWYSTPALLKEWTDMVLTWGWAYGRGGTALTGKRVLSVVTTGGPETSYARDGFHGFTLQELMAPIHRTVTLCHMEWLGPFAVHGTHRMDPDGIAAAAADYRALLEGLRDGTIDGTWLKERPGSGIARARQEVAP